MSAAASAPDDWSCLAVAPNVVAVTGTGIVLTTLSPAFSATATAFLRTTSTPGSCTAAIASVLAPAAPAARPTPTHSFQAAPVGGWLTGVCRSIAVNGVNDAG